MAAIDYQILYALQDDVLEAISGAETSFYLTGGTCLHRFYAQARYSEDLDFFTNDNALFREDVRIAQDSLAENGISFDTLVDTRDFVRLSIHSTLQVDMVNDRVYRYGRTMRSKQGIPIDNIQNICANKICALLGRDEPKDVFDLYIIFQNMNIDWKTSLQAAHKKCLLDPEIFEYRLSSFPLHLFDFLPILNNNFLTTIKKEYLPFVEAITRMI